MLNMWIISGIFVGVGLTMIAAFIVMNNINRKKNRRY